MHLKRFLLRYYPPGEEALPRFKGILSENFFQGSRADMLMLNRTL